MLQPIAQVTFGRGRIALRRPEPRQAQLHEVAHRGALGALQHVGVQRFDLLLATAAAVQTFQADQADDHGSSRIVDHLQQAGVVSGPLDTRSFALARAGIESRGVQARRGEQQSAADEGKAEDQGSIHLRLLWLGGQCERTRNTASC
jgi:hypothetical protein